MEKEHPYSIRQYIKDIAKYIKPYHGQFFTGLFFRFTGDVTHLYPTWAISQIILILSHPDRFTNNTYLIWIFLTWGCATLYFGSTRNLAKYFGYQVAEKASLDIYKDCLAHIFKLDLSWQEGENSGNKMKRMDRGLDGINMTIRRIFDVLIEVIVNTVGIVLIFFTVEKALSLALLFFIVSYFLLGTTLLKRAIQQEKIVNKNFENLSGITFEAINNIHTIKSLAIHTWIIESIQNQIITLISRIKERIFRYQSQGGILLLYELLFEFTIVAFLAWHIVHGRYDISLIILFIGLFQKITESTRELTDTIQQLALAKIWISRAMHILRTNPTIEHPEKIASQLAYPKDWSTLTLEHVHFTYKKGQALKDISFSIKRGEKVGIVGLSGAGKSTLFKLLLDLYEDYEGQILIGDTPLKQIHRQSYIDHVAVVLQDTELFNMTLRENIEIARVNHISNSQERLMQSIHMAHLEEVLSRLPQGMETIVGEKGIKLSGGQRQRVGIARALYRQPDILLLDEATSHLDAHSEKEIQQALQECIQPFTTIVIAHRLSTLKAMDKIVVLEHGSMIEQGTFGELVEKKGAFARMWQEQKI